MLVTSNGFPSPFAGRPEMQKSLLSFIFKKVIFFPEKFYGGSNL
jgi:hypothetical protein